VRAVNANAYRKHPSNSYSDGFGHSYCYSAAGNADTYSDTDATTYRDTDAKFAPDIAHASAQGNTKASSDAASSAVMKDW
jgi:hypothetical protein